ncbi:siderophore ABC transporter substrate-binding protein [Acinetobacter sp. MD2]|uniref:siderophore ABC transporter substrate-binding protein n=1 Tax=Acinetobacter sp. MD2 TaxID=2600066 RepID=UPI002D1E502C|nr:siderophore ABC transporter substrate-binding protein [Acinetobacter sp. MD2]MEB3766354.1 siderophore ABC transporter substrate-binding protein [Acinetobacter sp. MD2]
MRRNKRHWAVALMLISTVALSGCNQHANESTQNVQKLAEPITVQHALGRTIIDHIPQRVAVLDMNEADFLDQLNIPILGMPKDFIPHFLEKYKTDANVQDLGAIVQPNVERIYALKPDLILMTPLHVSQYPELSKIAPTIHYDINFKQSDGNHIQLVKEHLMLLGKIFNKEDLARQKVTQLETEVKQVQAITAQHSERALILLHNNGAFSNFGVNSRYGFVFKNFGVKPATTTLDTNLHGQPISSEFIKQANPDILYIVDRTAVMEHRTTINASSIENPLLRQTKAWKNGRVIFVDADAWYTTAASPTSLKIMMNDIKRGYP